MKRPVMFWSRAPFIRLLVPLCIGIFLQWHYPVNPIALLAVAGTSILIVLTYSSLRIRRKYQFTLVNGLAINVLLVAWGGLLVWKQDVRSERDWLGHHTTSGDGIVYTLLEPLVTKANSYKSKARADYLVRSGSAQGISGQVIIYFKKDASVEALQYGSRIVTTKTAMEIRNTGNPGAFDYKRYCLFEGVTHQLFLEPADFISLPTAKKDAFLVLIFHCREWVLQTIRKYIRGKKEQGLAEALLIGYKDDLDRDLVQSYSNTGVIHVIAISGLHLGLIYGILVLLTRPMKTRKLSWLRLVVTVSSLWMFSILAGGQPSVLRSALMFSCIAVGESISRKPSIYNSLALSAFLLLCYNPFWLWDAGFQLSYAAVAGIIMFHRPVYNLFYVPHPVPDFFWKLIAVTIVAQLLTLPFSTYHFHQFPNLFLFTNIVAVPLSSCILVGGIILCALSWLEPAAGLLGKILHQLIYYMNAWIETMEAFPFAVWSGLSINTAQAFLLLLAVPAFCFWLIEKQKMLFWLSGLCIALFLSIRAVSLAECRLRKKIIVYNIPKRTAVDVMIGNRFFFWSGVQPPDMQTTRFHLLPSRILHRTAQAAKTFPGTGGFEIAGKKILILDSSCRFKPNEERPVIDLLIMSGKPRTGIRELQLSFRVRQIVTDGSVPLWKSRALKLECESVGIPCHQVTENGAFQMYL